MRVFFFSYIAKKKVGEYMNEYFSNLTNYLNWQQQKIIQLEQQIIALEAKIQEIENIPQTHIDKIEYNFDQLKIEKLDGTLNIGLIPAGSESLEDFSVNKSKVVVPQPVPPLFQGVRNKVQTYLKEECSGVIERLETLHNYPLDEPYRLFILQDIENQLDERIRYYVEHWNTTNNNRSANTDEAVEQLFLQVKGDIEQSLMAFIEHLPQTNLDNNTE